MDERRRTVARRVAWLVAPVLAALAAPASGQEVRLTRGRRARHVQRGGGAGGVTRRPTRPPGAILRFDYTIPPGTAAGVWAKGFPEA
jgi:hypothetical protein